MVGSPRSQALLVNQNITPEGGNCARAPLGWTPQYNTPSWLCSRPVAVGQSRTTAN